MKKYTLHHRLLHWLIGVYMLGLFLTGFLRMEWMNRKNLAKIIKTQLANDNLKTSKESLQIIGKQVLEPMWEWHVVFAYSIVVLFTLRIIYMLVKGIKFPNPFSANSTIKQKFQGIIYILFYTLVLIDIITGFYIMWGDGSYKDVLEPIHKYSLYWFPIFLVLHIAGTVLDEITTKSGVVSKMINGKD